MFQWLRGIISFFRNIIGGKSMSNTHDVTLTATRDGNVVTISGSGAANLPVGSGAHRFKFILEDTTDVDVRFDSLDTKDDCSTCPPPPGQNSRQIVGYNAHNNRTPRIAGFTDNNSNNAANGPMSVSYQLNFTCNDPAVTVRPFDPIIINGGREV